ncbi:MAG: diguanylate cyclase [Desulfobacteraceae bacterium]|nr:diguanylate cyclase [Desulfobacteraceae bacterium]
MRPSIFNILPMLHFKRLESFLISLCILISIFIAGIFVYLDYNTSQLMVKRVREQAVAYLDLINHTKEWNFDYGGVYVEKTHGVTSNIYLGKLGINPDISCADKRVLTIRNHAIMTSEISHRSEHAEGVMFRMISLRPINPANTPDALERKAIAQFSKAKPEFQEITADPDQPTFRYVTPLYADSSCLGCHRGLSIHEGDILGAVSISIPIRDLLNETRQIRLIRLLFAIALIGILIAVTYFMTLSLANDLNDAQTRLKTMALTDELTGLSNRRQVMARLEEEFQRAIRLGESICIISLDIDHFKNINDTYGHQFGDLVLQKLAKCMQNCVRPYDIVGRVGGEEFLIIAPASPPEEALLLAERIIATIRQETISEGTSQVHITASAGVSVIKHDDADITDLLRRADRAMYQAKAEGRNRVAGP